ncbi:unnamed protein product [Dibothriocephalus latus]|uniref:Uncharacterized protein n=1 Tax=Dibothriocephalus latus TaxID=60516 RepID=A0A3P7LJ34_DIBLA|nr:unnamed protein product [Dibothriocephalus latus]
MNPFDFEAYKRADIYALGKIIWEVLVWGQRNLALRGAEDQPKATKTFSLNSADLSAHGHRHWTPLAGPAVAEDWGPHSSVFKAIVSEPHVTEKSSHRTSLEHLENSGNESQLQPVPPLPMGMYMQPAVGPAETGIPGSCRPLQGPPSGQWPSFSFTSRSSFHDTAANLRFFQLPHARPGAFCCFWFIYESSPIAGKAGVPH